MFIVKAQGFYKVHKELLKLSEFGSVELYKLLLYNGTNSVNTFYLGGRQCIHTIRYSIGLNVVQSIHFIVVCHHFL